ncbi:MAG: type VI secretion system tube protein Hcp [Rhodocyclaceae bacterium]|nr:type VI secretion system tube protein Hcp [Rhodocyclaceae bacterium]
MPVDAKDDIFLKIDGGRQGPIKGNSKDKVHAGEIDVTGWTWGMDGNLDAHSGRASRTTVHTMEVVKRADAATPALMSALYNNEPITKAVLTVRKAGGPQALEYLKVTMEKGRIVSYRAGAGESPEGPTTVETIRIAFQKIRVEHQDQDKGGGSRGTSTAEIEVTPGS